MATLQKSIAFGAVWMLLVKASTRAIGLVSTMILARLLSPGDYGLVAMAMSVYAFLEVAAAFGFEVVLIQKTTLDADDYNTAFTFNVLFYGLLSLVLMLIAPLAAGFYEEPRLTVMIWVLASAMFFRGFDNIALVDFFRELTFHKEFWFQLSVKVIGVAVTIPMAFVLRNYWALVIGIASERIGSVLLGYVFRPYRPRLTLARAREMFSFSRWLVLMNWMAFLEQRVPDVVLGKTIGSRAVGLYVLSAELSNYPSAEIVAPINRAVYPGYSKLKDKLTELRSTYLNVISLIALIVAPLGLGLSATAEYVVLVVLGDKWLEAIDILAILAVASTCFALTSNSGYVYYALGKPRVNFFITLFKVCLIIPLIIFLTQNHGVVGAAWTYLIVGLIVPWIHFTMIRRLVGIPYRQLVGAVVRPLISAGLMYGALQSAPGQAVAEASDNAFMQLLMSVTMGGLVYAAACLFLWVVAGRPEGGEALVLEKTTRFIKQMAGGVA